MNVHSLPFVIRYTSSCQDGENPSPDTGRHYHTLHMDLTPYSPEPIERLRDDAPLVVFSSTPSLCQLTGSIAYVGVPASSLRVAESAYVHDSITAMLRDIDCIDNLYCRKHLLFRVPHIFAIAIGKYKVITQIRCQNQMWNPSNPQQELPPARRELRQDQHEEPCAHHR